MFVGILLYFLGVTIYGGVTLIMQEIKAGKDHWQIAMNFKNILIFAIIGVASKIVTLIMHKQKDNQP